MLDPRLQLIEKLIEYKRFKQTIPVLLLLEEERFQQDCRGNFFIDVNRAGKIALPNEELEHLTLFQLLLTYSRIVKKNIEKDTFTYSESIYSAIYRHFFYCDVRVADAVFI